MSSIDDKKSLVAQVYRSNWVSFYEWKVRDSRDSLTSLFVYNYTMEEDADWFDIPSDEEDELFTDNIVPDADHVIVAEYSSSSQAITVLPTIGTTAQYTLEPHPNYTSTTPLRRSILVGDDLNPMPFIPFSDDPSFPHESHMDEHYETFAWHEMDLLDPDLEVICVQTVKDLMGDKFSLTFENILATKVMPRQLIQNIQLYTGARRRDYPKWPASDPLHPTTVPYSPHHTSHLSPSQTLTDVLQYFCISDCFYGYCSTHDYEPRSLPPSIPPTLSNTDLHNSITTSCSKYCFVLGRHTQTLSHWSPDDLSILYTTLRYSPDTSPCDLSTIVRKPCSEVATKRHQWLSTQSPLTTSKQNFSRKYTTSTKIEFADLDPETFVPNYPLLCVKCESRDPSTKVCRNTFIQHMRHKRCVVHRSKWGLGYYLAESAREGDLITEYIGDIIYDPTVRSRDAVAAHTNRQYMFKLNSLFTVDGTTAGNESRYINHASGHNANVRAHVRLVNSEHRIGIFACKDIEPGTELLLDYGSDFFNAHSMSTAETQPRSRHLRVQSHDVSSIILSASFLHQPPSESSESLVLRTLPRIQHSIGSAKSESVVTFEN
ncbi:hypothetical protein Ac2012v2_006771 [Leucoagaricus gongylophorus]